MDALSPISDFPSVTSSASKETKQPVYTTAGTLFDPSTATPIQPPTRRGRTLRFPSPAPSGFGTFENDSFKSGFPSFGRRAPSPNYSEKAQQYSPLQQNYDRAISPSLINGLSRSSSDMVGQPAPKFRSGNIPPPPGLGNGLEKQALAAGSNDAESDSSQEALVSQFKVKTLRSLASYPNPTQKAALKVLEKARGPIVAANVQDADRVATPSSLSYASSGPARAAAGSTTHLLPTQSNLTSTRMPASAAESTKSNDRLRRGLTTQRDQDQKAGITSALGQQRLATYTPLATGPGVPQPLTAGPPGQRQYRPSTLEPLIRALQGVNPRTQHHSDSLVHTQNRDALAALGAQRLSTATETETRVSPFRSAADSLNNVFSARSSRESATDHYAAAHQQPDMCIGDTLTAEEVRQYYPRGMPADYAGVTSTIPFNWTDKYPLHRETAKPFSPEEMAARNVKINNEWYAGTNLLGKSLRDVQVDADCRAFEVTVGAIGEERKQSSTRRASRIKGRMVYPHLPVEEASATLESRHAEPLLLMAYGSLLSYVTDNTKSTMSGFQDVDASLIDSSEAGRQSYFDPKKERKVARPRRSKGY
jgi:hypothetical protein